MALIGMSSIAINERRKENEGKGNNEQYNPAEEVLRHDDMAIHLL